MSSYPKIPILLFLQVKTKLKGHQNRITGLAFSQTLNVLVSSGADAQVSGWFYLVNSFMTTRCMSWLWLCRFSLDDFYLLLMTCSYVFGVSMGGRRRNQDSFKHHMVANLRWLGKLKFSFIMIKPISWLPMKAKLLCMTASLNVCAQ